MGAYLKNRLNKYFLRDIDISINNFAYFLASFVFFTISIEYLFISFLSLVPSDLITMMSLTTIIVLFLSLLLAGLIIDKYKDRMKLSLISGFTLLIGLFLALFSEPIIEAIGFSMIIFSTTIYLIVVLTIVTHESTILNRGRLFSILQFLSFITATGIIMAVNMDLLSIVVIEVLLFCIIYKIQKQYTYKETDERLRSDYKFREIITKHPILGYLTAFLVLGFILGNAFLFNLDVILDLTVFL